MRSVYDDDESAPCRSCAICLEQFQNGDNVCSSQNPNCDHVYHVSCILDWLLKSQECPCCRRNYLSIDRHCDVEAALPSVSIVQEINYRVGDERDEG